VLPGRAVAFPSGTAFRCVQNDSIAFLLLQHPSSSSLEFVIGAVLGIALVVGMLIVLVVYLRRKYMPGIPNVKLIATVNPEYVSTGKWM
jgi:hypothetical protein